MARAVPSSPSVSPQCSDGHSTCKDPVRYGEGKETKAPSRSPRGCRHAYPATWRSQLHARECKRASRQGRAGRQNAVRAGACCWGPVTGTRVKAGRIGTGRIPPRIGTCSGKRSAEVGAGQRSGLWGRCCFTSIIPRRGSFPQNQWIGDDGSDPVSSPFCGDGMGYTGKGRGGGRKRERKKRPRRGLDRIQGKDRKEGKEGKEGKRDRAERTATSLEDWGRKCGRSRVADEDVGRERGEGKEERANQLARREPAAPAPVPGSPSAWLPRPAASLPGASPPGLPDVWPRHGPARGFRWGPHSSSAGSGSSSGPSARRASGPSGTARLRTRAAGRWIGVTRG